VPTLKPAPVEAIGEPSPKVVPSELEVQLDLPMADRERKLSWLRGVWRQARRGRGRIVFISGPAGVGKTRLSAEFSAHVVSGGGVVRYVGAGGAAAGLAVAAVREAATLGDPTLVVLDDLDTVAEPVAEALGDADERINQAPVLVLGLVRAGDRNRMLAKVIGWADGLGDAHRMLAALGANGVEAIARGYVGDAVADAPIESMLRASAGVPSRIHARAGPAILVR
jgi:hypothetical protein